MSFVVDKDSLGKVLNLGDFAGIGMNLSLCFQPGVGMVVVRTIPHEINEAVKNETRGQRDLFKKGRLIGNTQRHWQPAASLPTALHNQWVDELGEPKHNTKAWKKRLNSNEYRDLRTSEGTL